MSLVKSKKLIIIGDSAFAEIAYEYFEFDSPYKVCAFSVEEGFLKKEIINDLPVVKFEDLAKDYCPDEYEVFVAVTYTGLNRLRTRLSIEAKRQGFKLASYISSKAFIWRNVDLGEHCFIFEGNIIQPFVKIGSNVILWSGNHIGHHSNVGNNCFISSHVVISGYCRVGDNTFMGVNTTVANNITLGADNWIGPGATISADTENDSLIQGTTANKSRVSAKRFFRVRE